MTSLFVARSGRVIPEPETDQAGSALRLRTVSRYTDGRPIDRPQLCLGIGEHPDNGSPAHCEAAIRHAAHRVDELERRGHVLIEDPVPPAEWQAVAARITGETMRAILRRVLVEGLPLGWAVDEVMSAGDGGTPAKRKNARRRAQRLLAELGWGADEGGDD